MFVNVNKFCGYWLKKFWSIHKALPFATPSPFLIQKRVLFRAEPQRTNPFLLVPFNQVIFCVRGVTTAPCGVPSFVSDHWPSSDTPAFSHLLISRSTRLSATRCCTNFIVHSWSMLSKDTTTHYPPSAL